jgi:hypothetical protein
MKMHSYQKKSRKKGGTLENEEKTIATLDTAQEDIRLPKVSDKWFVPKTIRRIIKTRSVCHCCCCADSGIKYNYEVLAEEIKSTQKSIAHCKTDTNKILEKVERLERYFQ